MRHDIVHLLRIAKRLNEAGGYLELGMTQQALDRLEGLEPLGPFEVEVALTRARALKSQCRYADAAAALKIAAIKSSIPQDNSALLALSLCYQQAGNLQQAVQMQARARGAKSSG